MEHGDVCLSDDSLNILSCPSGGIPVTYYNMKDSKKQHRVREDYHMKRQYYEQLGGEVHFQNKPSVATENRR